MKYPVKVLISVNDQMEFPNDWTHNPEHLNVALIHDFTTVLTAYNKAEWESLMETLECDYASDITEATLLFDDEDVWRKFKRYFPKPQSKARMVTEQDKEEYDL